MTFEERLAGYRKWEVLDPKLCRGCWFYESCVCGDCDDFHEYWDNDIEDALSEVLSKLDGVKEG